MKGRTQKIPLTAAEIRQCLEKWAEPAYQEFMSSLLPGTENILGVRLPKLRSLARRIAREDWRVYLESAEDDSYEEIMLQGIVIGCVDCPQAERLSLIRSFVPKMDNWGVCDSFCAGLVFAAPPREEIWQFIQPYAASEAEFSQRFAAVMCLDYFLEDAWVDRVLSLLLRIKGQGYYARMAVAWALAECFASYPEKVWPLLESGRIDPDTLRRTLQKIVESRKVGDAAKKRIRALRKQAALRARTGRSRLS